MLREAGLMLALLSLLGCAAGGAAVKPESKQAQAAALQVKMGQEYLTKGDLEQARDKLQRALDLDPNSVDAHTLVAVLNERIGRPEVAEKHYRRAVELKPEAGALNNNYGAFLCAQGRYDEAQQRFALAADDPFYKTPAMALANAGVCARKVGDAGVAESRFRRALELDARNLTALYELAHIAHEQGQHLRARAFIQRYEAVTPADAGLLLLASKVESKLGDKKNAAVYLDRLQRDFPDFVIPTDPADSAPPAPK